MTSTLMMLQQFAQRQHHKLQRLNQLFVRFPLSQKIFLGIEILGSLYILRQLSRLIPSQIFPNNLKQRYGEGSWVVVTGASDGIGKEFCYELAKEGFNIVLMSRSEDKMDQICKDIQQKYGVQSKILVTDFAKSNQLNFFEQIYQELQDLDISILVNNVGVSPVCGEFQKQHCFKIFVQRSFNEEAIQQTMSVNATSTLFMTKTLINKLLNREKKSAVITISSFLGSYPANNLTIYSATKGFQDYFTRSLIGEYGHKIDFLTVQPAGVRTDMLKKVKGGKFMITPQECAHSAIQELRHGKSFTYGHCKHKLLLFLRFQNHNKQASQIGAGRSLKRLFDSK